MSQRRRLSPLTQSLAAQILLAMGLSAALTTAASGCGGEVESTGRGGAGGVGGTTTAGGGGTGGTASITPGRPFVVAGEARSAEVCEREDWLAVGVVPNLADLDDGARRALAAAWAEDGRVEHAAVASFARFGLELLAVGAPADLVREASKALSDEVRHAELCFALASAYADEPLGPACFPLDRGHVERTTLLDIAVATVHEGCINETLSALTVAAAQQAARDPAVRGALAEIARDEAAHAALAWRFVAWACQQDEAVREAVAAAIDHAGALERPLVPLPAGVDEATLRAHGRLGEAEQREIIETGLTEVVLPCARALLEDLRKGTSGHIAPTATV